MEKRKIIIEISEDDIKNEELLQIICATAFIKQHIRNEPNLHDYIEVINKKERQVYRLLKKSNIKLAKKT